MAQFKCVVFDVDGTLLDTSEGLISSVRYTVDRYGLDPIDDETIRTFIGPPIQDSFRRIYGFSDAVIREVSAAFREHYKEVDLLKAKPYEGIFRVIEKIKEENIEVAIATYKRQDYAAKLLEHFGFNRYTDHIFGSDFDGKLKKKDIIELALKHAGIVHYSDAVMIGDSDNDAIGAKGIGTAFLGVTYGFGCKTKKEILEFRSVGAADTPEEIVKVLFGG